MGSVVSGLAGEGKKVQKTKASIPHYLTEASQDAVGKARTIADKKYQGFGGTRVAGPADNEQTAYLAASNFANAYKPQIGRAASALDSADRSFANADLSGYMNPYIDAAIDPAADKLTQRFAEQRNQRNAAAAARGAFGGLRNTLAQQDAEDNYLSSIADLYSRGRADAYNQAAARWTADRNNQIALAQQQAALGQTGAALAGQQIQNQLAAGGDQRAIDQARNDFDYQQFREQRDWDRRQLQPLLQAVSSVPYTRKQTTTNQTQHSTGQKIGQGIGAAASIASMFVSSKAYKTDKAPVAAGTLDKIAALPVETWRYKGERARHVGPYAEDMRDQMGIGTGREIPVVDAIGAQYAGLKEAAQRIQRLEKANTS